MGSLLPLTSLKSRGARSIGFTESFAWRMRGLTSTITFIRSITLSYCVGDCAVFSLEFAVDSR